MKAQLHEHHTKSIMNVSKNNIPIVFVTAIFLAAVVSCKTPTEITARPDPTAATSGTLGSSKATDGIIPLQPAKVRDTTREQ